MFPYFESRNRNVGSAYQCPDLDARVRVSATAPIIDRRIPRYDVGSVCQTLRGVFRVTIFVIRIPGTNFINTVVDFSCFVTNTGDASENYFEQAN